KKKTITYDIFKNNYQYLVNLIVPFAWYIITNPFNIQSNNILILINQKEKTMKKSAQLLSLLAVLAGFSTIAAAEGVFVGGSLDLQHSKTKNTLCDNDDGDCSAKDTRLGVGLKAGYDFNQFRVYGAYQYNPKAKDRYQDYGTEYEVTWKNHNLTVGADYTPSFTDNFKGLVGGYLGYSHLTLTDDEVGYNEGSASTNGFIYGLRLGGIYSFNEHNELEFGVKAEQAKYKTVSDDRWDFKEKNTNYGAFVGYNYKF
ncbi:MAG: porin family protein, partial [Neisseriaceae bacterium]|nr:porin family protein [Neisseriaceae bacterium]